MLFVAFVEVVVVFGRILLGAITFQNSFVLPFPPLPSLTNLAVNSLLSPLFFAHFLRLRYYLSPPTRQAFSWVSAQIDHATANPKCPPQVRKGVNFARELVSPLLCREDVASVSRGEPARDTAVDPSGLLSFEIAR